MSKYWSREVGNKTIAWRLPTTSNETFTSQIFFSKRLFFTILFQFFYAVVWAAWDFFYRKTIVDGWIYSWVMLQFAWCKIVTCYLFYLKFSTRGSDRQVLKFTLHIRKIPVFKSILIILDKHGFHRGMNLYRWFIDT